jgi:hypothetical protein
MAALSVIPLANAYTMPDNDLQRFQQFITENAQQVQHFIQTEVLDNAKLAAMARDAQNQAETYNNGFANWIARADESVANVFNLEQQSRARPVQQACGVIGVAKVTSSVECAQDDLKALVKSTSQPVTSYITDFAKKAASTLGLASSGSMFSTANVAASSSAEGAQKTQSEKNLEDWYAKIEAAVDENDQWLRNGRLVNDPSLLLMTETDAPVYTDEELMMAVNQADLTYPDFIRKDPSDPQNAREAINDVRMKNAVLVNNQIIYDQIALRTAPADGMPSKMMSMVMPVQIKLDNDGQLQHDGDSWIHKIALNEATTPAEVSKEALLMKGLKLQQMLASYKAALQTEDLVLNAYLQKVDSFSR